MLILAVRISPSLLDLSHTGKATDQRCAPDKVKKQICKGTARARATRIYLTRNIQNRSKHERVAMENKLQADDNRSASSQTILGRETHNIYLLNSNDAII